MRIKLAGLVKIWVKIEYGYQMKGFEQQNIVRYDKLKIAMPDFKVKWKTASLIVKSIVENNISEKIISVEHFN